MRVFQKRRPQTLELEGQDTAEEIQELNDEIHKLREAVNSDAWKHSENRKSLLDALAGSQIRIMRRLERNERSDSEKKVPEPIDLEGLEAEFQEVSASDTERVKALASGNCDTIADFRSKLLASAMSFKEGRDSIRERRGALIVKVYKLRERDASLSDLPVLRKNRDMLIHDRTAKTARLEALIKQQEEHDACFRQLQDLQIDESEVQDIVRRIEAVKSEIAAVVVPPDDEPDGTLPVKIARLSAENDATRQRLARDRHDAKAQLLRMQEQHIQLANGYGQACKKL